MSELSQAGKQSITELAAYHEAVQNAKAAKDTLVQKLGSLVGQAIDIEGYPSWAVYRMSDESDGGRPRFTSVPVGRTHVSGVVSYEPKPYTNRQLLKVVEEEVLISSSQAPVDSELTDSTSGTVVAYRFNLRNILSISIAEPQE